MPSHRLFYGVEIPAFFEPRSLHRAGYWGTPHMTPEVKPGMATHNFRGLTARQANEVKDGEPLDVSLFIGGREFYLEGIALSGGASLLSALIKEREELDDTIKHHLAEHARSLEMTVKEARMFLVERALYLDRFIDELSQAPSD